MKTPILRISLAFGNLPDNTRITFARNVQALIYGPDTVFLNPPVTGPVLLASIDAFADAKAAQPHGGKAATALKDEKRAEMTEHLRKLAAYVQDASDNQLAKLLLSGFEAVSQNRASYPLSKPMILRIAAGMTGESLVTISTEPVARGCEIRVAEIGEDGAPGPFRPAVFGMSSRNVSIPGLTPGKLFAYQGRTVGGSTTYSDWSDQIVQRAA